MVTYISKRRLCLDCSTNKNYNVFVMTALYLSQVMMAICYTIPYIQKNLLINRVETEFSLPLQRKKTGV